MSETAKSSPSRRKTKLAYETMAIRSRDALDLPPDDRRRLRILGDYLLVCGVKVDSESDTALSRAFATGLLNAGVEPETAQQLANQFANRSVERYVFSLGLIPDDDHSGGIERGQAGLSFDSSRFIESILEQQDRD